MGYRPRRLLIQQNFVNVMKRDQFLVALNSLGSGIMRVEVWIECKSMQDAVRIASKRFNVAEDLVIRCDNRIAVYKHGELIRYE